MANKKHFVWGTAAAALLFAAAGAFTGCDGSGDDKPSPNVVPPVTDFDLSEKIKAPKAEATIPDALVVGESSQYTGTIAWFYETTSNGRLPVPATVTAFLAETQYTAVVTLTVTAGYTLADDAVFTHEKALQVSYNKTDKQVTLTFTSTHYEAAGLYVNDDIDPEDAVDNLAEAFAWIGTNATANYTYTIVLWDDVASAPYTLNDAAVRNQTGVTIILTTTLDGFNGVRTISLSADNASMFSLETDVKLILDEGVVLAGHANNPAHPLVSVTKGTLEMLKDAKITGNENWTNSQEYQGGGVAVSGENAVFNMRSGAVSGNTANRGGGVFVENKGTFNMFGGEISGNITKTSNNFGGGLCIGEEGIFAKTGGIIYGDATEGQAKNNKSNHYGDAVYHHAGDGGRRNNDVTDNIGVAADGTRTGHWD